MRNLVRGLTATLMISALFVAAGCESAISVGSGASPVDSAYLAELREALQLKWPKNHTINIVCHGHSVPSGYFVTPEVHSLEAYPNGLRTALAKRYPYAVINVIVTGISGENSEEGARRFEQDVLSHRPDVITIDYALNDRGLGLEASRAAWVSMIEAALARQIKVILLTPSPDLKAKLDDPADPLNQQAAQIRALAAEYRVGLVDSLRIFQQAAMHGGMNRLMVQYNHPNAEGHRLIAAALAKWFE